MWFDSSRMNPLLRMTLSNWVLPPNNFLTCRFSSSPSVPSSHGLTYRKRISDRKGIYTLSSYLIVNRENRDVVILFLSVTMWSVASNGPTFFVSLPETTVTERTKYYWYRPWSDIDTKARRGTDLIDTSTKARGLIGRSGFANYSNRNIYLVRLFTISSCNTRNNSSFAHTVPSRQAYHYRFSKKSKQYLSHHSHSYLRIYLNYQGLRRFSTTNDSPHLLHIFSQHNSSNWIVKFKSKKEFLITASVFRGFDFHAFVGLPSPVS